MGYSSDEIQASVEKIVQSTIATPYGQLGNRNTLQTFNDFQNAAAGVLVNNSGSAFYVVKLGCQRLVDLVLAEASLVLSLIEALDNAGRKVNNIDNLAPLANARSALAALSSAAASRSTSFTTIQSVPAYKRFDQSTQRFLDTASQAIKGADVVPTPQEARDSLAGLVSQLQESQVELIQRVSYLANAIADYDALQLPSILASGILTKSQQVLSDHFDTLNALTPEQRLTEIRDVSLDVMSSRAAVAAMAALTPTTTFALLQGNGTPYYDVDHPVTPASAIALAGPYPIYNGHSDLSFVMDSSFSFSVPMPGSFLAQIDSTVPAPYVVVNSGGNSNRHLIVDYDSLAGGGRIEVNLPTGTNTAGQIAFSFNSIASPTPVQAQAILATLKYRGLAGITNNAGPGATFALPVGTWDAMGVRVGDLVDVTDLTSVNHAATYTVTSTSGNLLVTSGSATVTEAGLFTIDVGTGRTVRFTVKPTQSLAALNNRLAISFPNIPQNTALNPTYVSTPPFLFGFTPGAVIRSRSTEADTITVATPTLLSTQLNGVPRLGVTAELAPFFTGRGRTDPDNPSKLIAFYLYGRASVPDGQMALVFTTTEDTSTIVINAQIAVRESGSSSNHAVLGVVTAVNGQEITCDMVTSIVADSNMLIEVGPSDSAGAYLDLRVSDSSSQDGDYTMDVYGQFSVTFEYLLERPVPFNRAVGGLPQFFNLAVGHKRAIFSSTTTNLTSRVEAVATTASASFFTGGVADAVGNTPYLQLPRDPKTIAAGDSLEVCASVYNQVTSTYAVTDYENALKLVTLEPPLPVNTPALNFSTVSLPPFARIRLAKKNNFSILKAQLGKWLVSSVAQPAWFTQLYALINPIAVSKNPTPERVNTAKLYVQSLLGLLTVSGASSVGSQITNSLESALESYACSPEDSVDTLVQTYLAKGAERGVDMFLQGRFSAFFGLTQEGLSYGGNFREQLKQVAMLDLPVNKTGRIANIGSEINTASWQDPDYELDFSDAGTTPDVDIPGSLPEISPPGR